MKHSLDGRADSAVRRRDPGAGIVGQACPASRSGAGVVPGAPPGSGRSNVACMEPARAKASADCCRHRRGDQLRRVLRYMLDENEFLSPYGIRSLSRVHKDDPFVLQVEGDGVSRGLRARANRPPDLFGGNSNWRGPIWFPVNYLHHRIAAEVPSLLRRRVQGGMSDRFRQLHDAVGSGGGTLTPPDAHLPAATTTAADRAWRRHAVTRRSALARSDAVLRILPRRQRAGLGASHQTGWTGLVAKLLQQSGE